jgi:outer membrane protein insertion porin family
VKEKPTIREILYVGHNSVSNSDILDRFKQDKVGLVVESQYDPTRIKKAEVSIKALLAEHGHQFATIRTEIRQIPPAAVGITFVIKEGPKVKVGKIKFEGNKAVKSRFARGHEEPEAGRHSALHLPGKHFRQDLRRHQAGRRHRAGARRVPEPRLLQGGVNDPKTEIHDTGHKGFHIPLLQSGPGKAVDITMPIEEGEKYRLGKITFKNNKAITNVAALRSLFPLKDGDIFSRDKIAKGLEAMRKAYGEYGYINYTAFPIPPLTTRRSWHSGNRHRRGQAVLRAPHRVPGNTTTRDKVIRRELALEEGGVYNSRLWELSLLRLNQLSYFDQLKPDDPNVTDKKLDEKNGQVDLTLKVHEKARTASA